MEIYIKGMEMPTEEQSVITINIYSDGVVTCYDDDVERKAVSVPPHGRLIDADALWVEINKICDRRDAGIIFDLTCLQQLLSAVRHAPTIIPAEEGE